VLSAESQKENGPFDSRNRRVLVFSMGAANESHGAALASNIDDYAGMVTATTVCMRLGLTYVGHLPYSGDRAGEMARDWNPGYLARDELRGRVVEDVTMAVDLQGELGNKASLVVVVSGHGGNNLLEEEEAAISKALEVPFRYVRPFPNGSSVRSKKNGRVEITHADDGEHSVGLYLGLLDKKKLRKINDAAKGDPKRALRQDPALMGLGYYVLPELSGDRYEDLRARHGELLRTARKFLRDRRVVADYDLGRKLMDKNVADTLSQVKRIIRQLPAGPISARGRRGRKARTTASSENKRAHP
jgi:creatinine amidohydrolase/Fe(II)-dependent formamide hydrolase-like protein